MIKNVENDRNKSHKFKKTCCSLKSLNIVQRINNYHSLQFHHKIVRSPVKLCPFHFANNLPSSKYLVQKVGVNNKQHKHQIHPHSKSKQVSRNSSNSHRKEIKQNKVNVNFFYNRSQRGEIKKIKQLNNNFNKFDDRKKERLQQQSKFQNSINKSARKLKNSLQEQNIEYKKNINTETSIIENNSSNFYLKNIQNPQSKQKNNQMQAKLSISTLPSQIISEASGPKHLQYEKVLNLKIQNNQQQVQLIQENNRIKEQLNVYKNQCKMLQQELRITLDTVKSMTNELQIIKTESKINEKKQKQTDCLVQKPKNQSKVSLNSYNNILHIKTQESQHQLEEEKNVEKTSAAVITTIRPTIFSSSSPRVIRIGRDRNYCVKGCVNFCNCLCPSVSNQQPL